MRTLFLLLAILLLAGCGDLRTHPVGGSPPAIPKLTTPPEDPIVTTEKELFAAEFSQSSPGSRTWQKGTPNGGIIVTLSPENGVNATAQYNRTDGKVVCKIPGPRTFIVHRIQSQDAISTAAQLIVEFGCTPA